jgi:uncharacterized protein with GYD domain
MATYILLITLTPEGQVKALDDPDYLLKQDDLIDVPGVATLGCYAVLGPYDFVMMAEADDNEQVAKFSLELGVRAGVHVTTLPAVPVGRLDDGSDMPSVATDVQLTRPIETL